MEHTNKRTPIEYVLSYFTAHRYASIASATIIRVQKYSLVHGCELIELN